MDFLSNLFSKDDFNTNPLKAFAILVAAKFEDVDEKNDIQSKALKTQELDIVKIKENMLTKQEKKELDAKLHKQVCKEEFYKLKSDFQVMKGRWTAYVVVITVLLNLGVWLIKEFVFK